LVKRSLLIGLSLAYVMKTDKSSPEPGDRQFTVAIIFIVAFLVLLAISLIDYFVEKSLELIKYVGTLFGGWVGMIIGFYFGQRPVDQLTQNLKEERARTDKLTEQLRSTEAEMWKRVEGKTGG